MEQIFTDKLTGIYNEKYIKEVLKQEIVRARRYKRPLSVLVFEIDYNYFIKDHNIKAEMEYAILKQFAALCLKVCRDVDILGRYLGDLFCIILPETSPADALIAAERLRKAVEEHKFKGSVKVEDAALAVNVGVAALSQNMQTAQELIAAAHDAVLEARSQGSNKVILSKKGGL